MIEHLKCSALLATCLLVGGCDAARQQAIPIVLKTEKGEHVTLKIPRGYIEEPKNPEGALVSVVLRIGAKEFSGAAFAPESEVRMQMEARSGKADAARSRLASAMIRVKWSEEAIVKSAEKSKKGLTAYSYPHSKEAAEGYYLTSSTGDVFVECRRSVCTAYKTWTKRVHLRIDYQPVNASDIAAVDAAVDGMLRSFAPAAEVAN
jgi:desulfoferrodoxin (superoxide reductase-like protein)